MTGRREVAAGRRRRAALIAVPAVVIVAVAVGAIAAAAPHPAAEPSPSAPSSFVAHPSASVTPSPSAVPRKSTTPAIPPTTVPGGVPQPTRTVSISTPATIVTALTAQVTRMEAVIGKADGPGEIGGPAVRFTITITNRTGKTVNLSDTAVNAYSGAAATPAVPLRMPGGVAFPGSVANGRSATGVFVFNIPVASRSLVKVTVDTSVRNPVVAFRGAAPK